MISPIKKRNLKKLLNRLEKSRANENHLEVILIGNILIRSQIKLIYESVLKMPANDKVLKFNGIINSIIAQPFTDGSSFKMITKKNLKGVKVWKQKFDAFYKTLKWQVPTGSAALSDETLKIAAMLQTMLLKL